MSMPTHPHEQRRLEEVLRRLEEDKVSRWVYGRAPQPVQKGG